MKIPEHFALSFLLAQFSVQQVYGPGGTALMIVAGILPDLDGLSILGGWRCHRTYHRVVGHGLPVTLAGPALLALLGSVGFGLGGFVPLWLWLQAALLAHLLTDVCFYRWPAQLLWPFSSRGWGLGLIGWNDLVPTLLLYAGVAWTLVGDPTWVAAIVLGLLAAYVACRAWVPLPRTGWCGWITGNWARRSAPAWRWLTGDFIT
jgi:membrane-bound metal-dependent hydrolase YbcI (DUF457 family)